MFSNVVCNMISCFTEFEKPILGRETFRNIIPMFNLSLGFKGDMYRNVLFVYEYYTIVNKY